VKKGGRIFADVADRLTFEVTRISSPP